MRARRNDRGLVGGGAAIVLLVLGLLLRAAPFGHDAPRAAAFALAFDPAGTICTAHPDPAGAPDDKDRPPGRTIGAARRFAARATSRPRPCRPARGLPSRRPSGSGPLADAGCAEVPMPGAAASATPRAPPGPA